MEEIIEEVIENVYRTDSQKSVATSFMYSLDFTDSSSDKNHSSGMDTYTLDYDSEASESPRNKNNAVLKDKPDKYVQINNSKQHNESTTLKSLDSITAQEIFTQTSKTIIELATNDGVVVKSVDYHTLETQTSMISITKDKTIKYRIEYATINKTLCNNDIQNDAIDIACEQLLNKSLEDGSSKLHTSQNEKDSVSEKLMDVNQQNPRVAYEDYFGYVSNSDFDHSFDASDVEEDSLMEVTNRKPIKTNKAQNCDTPKSVDGEVAELYTKLHEIIDFKCQKSLEHDKPDIEYLTPLSEESVTRQNSVIDFKPIDRVNSIEDDKDVLFTNKSGVKVKLFPKNTIAEAKDLKLPPIQATHDCSKNANLNFLFSLNTNNLQVECVKTPYIIEDKKGDRTDRWELGARELASGEGSFVNRNDVDKGIFGTVILPPIHVANAQYRTDLTEKTTRAEPMVSEFQSSIDVKDKIKELKMSHKGWSYTKFCLHKSGSRSVSPSTEGDESTASSPAQRGCELLCMELLKRLRSASWFDVVVALEDILRHLEKFWSVITEYRIADLLRQVAVHIESPRMQVARTACNTLAAILKNTNYTKKPEFYEAVTILLTKTGSFSRPIRRAANIALDDIICGVDLSHVVTAICIHGTTHKSPLVRCATARLLVVCCALGGGGRELLRARPPTAACARRHVLRSLAMLLEDKNTDTRKYAERLYSMLRPLSSFKAYYISDLDVELASRQIKKYDQLLLCGPPHQR